MNITTQVSDFIKGDLGILIKSTPEIQFYSHDKYQWRDSRYLETSDIWSNKKAESFPELIDIFKAHIESKRVIEFTLEDIIDAVQYGFDYRVESMNDGKSVPLGNVLQHLMYTKKLSKTPEEFKKLIEKYKNEINSK